MSSLLFKLLNLFLESKDSVLDFIYPPHCLVCGRYLSKKEGHVCEGCWNGLGILPHPFCPDCKSFFPEDKDRCFFCSGNSNLSWVRSLGTFDDFYQELIHQFKYKGKVSLGKRLSRRLSQQMKKDNRLLRFDLLIPVPLHPAKRRERGYNQSEILGKVISREMNIPLLKNALKRIKKTEDQTKLSDEERKENVKDAFEVSSPEVIEDKRIVLVDDVITTGATLNECARVLKDNGAKKVVGATLVLAFK
ncbi:MAG: hypothetical protein AMJ90_02195 [candidate division Zixibacteria bacterium SM23_73_2]|nr:MAG: hypothetical protein AMJ90_02195 [candidate division Zixibacteria bacterium SM23_73_2]